jgi:hypothetical protein
MQGRIVRGSGGNGIKRRLESDVLANWRRSSGDEGSQIPITKIGEDNLACVCARRLCRSGRRPMRSPLYCDAALEVVGGKNACLNRSVKRRSLHLDRIHFFSCTTGPLQRSSGRVSRRPRELGRLVLEEWCILVRYLLR